MTREEAINKLEYLINSPVGREEIDETCYEVMEYLSAQEPRVMTLEEALGEDECWIEGRSGACGYGDALISDDGERVDFYRPHSIATLDFYAYGMTWRCWTARPSEEQRRETPWTT